jgi:hypothetical protein
MRQSRELTLTSGLLLILASLASAQPASSGKKADNQKLVPAGEILVKILAVNASDHSLQVELGRPSQRLTLQTTDDVKVRWYNLPVKYDDKGNPTRYTSSEIRQLQERGLPGYTADFDSLKAGQTARLYLKKSLLGSKQNQDKKDSPAAGQTMPSVQASMILIYNTSGR